MENDKTTKSHLTFKGQSSLLFKWQMFKTTKGLDVFVVPNVTVSRVPKEEPNMFQQHLENLPAEILNQPRFFEVGADKIPHVKDWGNPKNQKLPAQVPGIAGFDTTGHGQAPDYFFVDFDHILDEHGQFLNLAAEKWFNYLSTAETYCETSKSGDGLHFLFNPTKGKFPPLTGSTHCTIFLDETNPKSKIELFYRQGARYCLFTGNVFKCSPKTPIVQGEIADEFIAQLCNELTVQNASTNQNAAQDLDIPLAPLSTAELQKLLSCLPCAKLTRNDWWLVGAIIEYEFGSGSFEIWRAWSETDSARYSLKACKEQWADAVNRHKRGIGKPAKIGTLIDMAKKFGYKPPKKAPARENIEFAENDSVETRQAKIRALCEWAKDKNGNPTRIKPTVNNYNLIFSNDINLTSLFGRDDFRQEIIFKRRAPWHKKTAPLKDSWDDSDDAELRLYLAENYAEMSSLQRTIDYTTRVARENSFHSIARFFDGLPTWDNSPRMETIFIKFLGADDNEYTRAVTRHFLFGAIARAFYPGCDFQSVPVLLGAQGIGKSRLLRMLGGKHGVNKNESWHIALRDQLDDSHAVDAMRKGWIVEIEEFAAGSRADVNAMKGVLSADDITRRFAYDRRARTVKAHWVFIATCNDDAPLRDQTGARRFLPIFCHNKESQIVDGMTLDYIQQVWAEAYQKFKEMFPTVDSFDEEKLRLPIEIQLKAAQYAAGITQDDGLTNEIKGFLDQKILPLVIWYLLSREERRKFHVNGSCLIMKNAIAELNFRRRARGGNPDQVQKDIDEINKYIDSAGKNENGEMTIWVEEIYRGENNPPDKIYHINGTETRTRICQGEIFNECFGADNRKRINRINEILSRLDGWHLGERLRYVDPCYPDQKKVYYRNSV